MKMNSLLAVPFDTENYYNFAKEFFKEIEKFPYKELKPNATFLKSIDYYAIHGTYKDPEGNDIIVLSVKIKNNSNARQAQRNFVSYLLTNDYNQFSAAMVAYYDDVRTNWKLSFVTVELEIGDKGLELNFKPAKRYSFLVGKDEPTKTYVQQLGPIYESNINPNLSDISEAFSVNRLSKDFYEDYKAKFFELVDYLVNDEVFRNESHRLGFENEGKFAVTFAKKTLGQMVFLHFVQKKGWLGVSDKWGDGDQKYLLNSIINFNGDSYFNDYLEPLFYSALNYKRENDIYLGMKIPFLNGGLFHPIEYYDWKKISFHIPNDYWFNEKETGLLNILSQYNFTVDETDPSEQEVAIDPEMLGKIFESLLDVNDRSSLGAFYTPREIVHFMCEEALAERISTILTIDKESIINYIRYGEALKDIDFIVEFADEIDDIVSEITIVDPAVGSGAFLVGMLNQIIKLRTNLSRFTHKNISKYDMKLQAIQKSLYGVDIEYDAIEIAKLRLWLSLIVDQETVDTEPKPLPNLNFCLRIGNSLVDTFENIKLWNAKWKGSKKDKQTKIVYQTNIFNTETINSITDDLKKSKVLFFNTLDEDAKRDLLIHIERQQLELIRSELIAKGKYDLFDRINEMIRKKTKPFFIWELEFSEVFENGGFDIVIANPPYVQLQKDGGKLANELKDQGYDSFTRTGDIYCIFYEKAISILKDSGVAAYITSNKWMRAGYGEKLREFLAKNTNPSLLIDFGGNKVFESATVDVNILIYKKEDNMSQTVTCLIGDDCTKELSDYIKQHEYINSFISNESWILLSEIETTIRNKIESSGCKLSNWQSLSINRGILTGYNEAFIIDSQTRDILINEDIQSIDLIRPILRGKDIKRYTFDFAEKWLICIPCGFTNNNAGNSEKSDWFKDAYPFVYNYFTNIEEQLSKKRTKNTKGLYERDDQGDFWWELRSCKYMDDFAKQKIIYPCIMTKESSFMFDINATYFTIAPGNIISGENLEYLISFLNSKTMYFALRKFYMGGGIDGELKTNRLLLLPVILPENNVSSLEITSLQKQLQIKYSTTNCIDETLIEQIENLIQKSFELTDEEVQYINSYVY